MDRLSGRRVLGKITLQPQNARWRRLTLIYMDHLMDVAIGMTAVPTYQPEVVLQHLQWDHGCISHTTEAAFLGTYEK